MKFKVGDTVRIMDGSKAKHYAGGWVGEMEKYVGREAVISRFSSFDDQAVRLEGIFWTFDVRYLEPAHPKIVITTDGKTTCARYYTGKRVIYEALAKCHPSDKFEFDVGAHVAMHRLLEQIGSSQLDDDLSQYVQPPFNGKIVCVEAPSYNGRWEKGRIYEVNGGVLHDRAGNIVGSQTVSSLKEINDLAAPLRCKFIEIVD